MRILCLGSLNFDYVYKVEHLVRSGETIAATDRTEFCGGKGLNQAISLARAGAEVYQAGKIGGDGIELRYKMMQYGVNTDFVIVDSSLATGHAFIQVDPRGQSSIVNFGGANFNITKQDIDGILASFKPGDIILLQNEISNVVYAIAKASQLGLRVALNPSPIDNELISHEALACVEWFILNEIEGYELTGQREPEDICSDLRNRYPNCRVVLTLGDKGVIYRDAEISASHGIYDVPVVDSTGAGDAFVGYFLAAIMEDASVEKALELASKASSLAVSRDGSADSIPSRKEVEKTDITPYKGK